MEKDFFYFESAILSAAQRNDFARVLRLSEECQAHFPQHPFGFKAQGFAYVQLNQKHKALPAMYQAVLLDPLDAESLSNYGQTLTDCATTHDDFLQARSFLEEALRIAPESAVFLNNLAANLINDNDPKNLQKAKELALRAIQIDSHNAMAYNNVGLAFYHLKQDDFAKEYLEKALQINPKLAQALDGLGHLARKKRKPMQALFYHQQAVECNPDNPKLVLSLAKALHDVGETPMARVLLQELEKLPNMAYHALQYRMMMDPYCESTTLEMVSDVIKRLKKITQEIYPQKLTNTAPIKPKERLRIGFLTADLRQHVCSFFIFPLLLGKEKINAPFDFIALDTSDKLNSFNDETAEVFLPYFSEWHYVRHLHDKELANFIQEKNIDILLDLSGYTDGNRLSVFSLNPAPVSATWIGWLGSTGFDGIGHILVNSILVPQKENEAQFSEKALYLKHSWACYHPAGDMPPLFDLPALKNKHITFGAFHNPNKVQEPTLKLWAAVLQKIPNAKLIWVRGDLADKALADKYRNKLRQLGVLPHQVHLFANRSAAQYVKQYQNIDFVLDTYPASAGATACEALYNGIPLVTLTGTLMASRLSANALTHCGLSNWICSTQEEYVEKACLFAQDFVENAPKWNAFRHNLRTQFMNSPMGNAALFAEDFLGALKNVYDSWRFEELEKNKKLKN